MRLPAALAALLLAQPVYADEDNGRIYRWEDEQGRVHFSDCPPRGCPPDTPAGSFTPSPERVREARQRTRELEEFLHDMDRRGRAEAEERTEVKSGRRPYPEIDCFARLTAGWGGRIADEHRPVQRRPLSRSELDRLRSLFERIDGHHDGHMQETTCIDPAASPAVRRERFRVDLKVARHEPGIYRIDARGVAPDTGTVIRQSSWFLLHPDGLRYRRAESGLPFHLDRARHDVETLRVDDRGLLFFTRRGGPVRRVRVTAIQRLRQGFELHEYSYAQGRLAGKRLWRLRS